MGVKICLGRYLSHREYPDPGLVYTKNAERDTRAPITPFPIKNTQKRIYTTDIYKTHFLHFLKTSGYIRKKCPYISEKHRPPPGKTPRIYTGPAPPTRPHKRTRGGALRAPPLVSKPKKRALQKVKKLKIKASWKGGNRGCSGDRRGSRSGGRQRGNSAGR